LTSANRLTALAKNMFWRLNTALVVGGHILHIFYQVTTQLQYIEDSELVVDGSHNR